jgi:hypothetical protein
VRLTNVELRLQSSSLRWIAARSFHGLEGVGVIVAEHPPAAGQVCSTSGWTVKVIEASRVREMVR